MTNYQKINIAFRAAKNIESDVIGLSQEIGKKSDSCFILDGINFYPHITIYASIFSKSNLSNVLEKVGDFVRKINSINFKFKNITSGQGFISLNFDLSDEIESIHREIVELFNPLREKITEDDLKDYNMVFNQEQKKNIINYGYPDAIDLYLPHMTIIRLKDEKMAKDIAKEIKWNNEKFKARSIVCYLMGDNGTCNQIIKEFNLK